jgi:hypothetical protein
MIKIEFKLNLNHKYRNRKLFVLTYVLRTFLLTLKLYYALSSKNNVYTIKE